MSIVQYDAIDNAALLRVRHAVMRASWEKERLIRAQESRKVPII